MSSTDGRPQCLCETFARVTERSALAGARWLGRADQDAAEEAAFSGARIALEQLPISGHVVIGAHEDAEQLATGTTIGAGGEEYDLALDPLEGRAVVARGGTNDHLSIGIGGTRQAVLAAAALRCLGGELQAQLWPTRRAEIEEAHANGIDDVERVFTIDDLAPQEVIVAATGVSNGDLLRGVRFLADSARTHSLVMCTRCNWVRFVDGIHFFARERREEVRLS